MTPQHPRLPSLRAIARHAAPNVLIATIVPTGLFYAGWFAQGRSTAFCLALAWALTMLAWRAVRRQRVPALLVMTTLLLTLRTAVGLITGSATLYFLQPIATMVILGALFLVSLAAGQPLITKLAGDFWPLPPEVAERAEMRLHFRRLSVLWAAVYFSNAAVTLFLLMNLPVTTYVATKTVTSLAITWCGIVVTVASTLRLARRTDVFVQPAPA